MATGTELKVEVTDIPGISALLPAALDGGRLAVALPPGGTGLTDAELRATPVPVSGSFFQATQPVSGTFWQATQPVSGTLTVNVGLTNAELRAVAVPVSGTFWQNTQPISAVALPLPLGAATEATLATLATDSGLSSVWTRLGDGSQHTIVDSLPVGLATSALQTTGNTSLGNIDTKTPAAGQALMAASSPVVIASNQSAVPVSGTFYQATQPVSGTFWPTAAASPSSCRLSDGAAFYDGTKTGQLPSALVASRLDCNAGAWLGSTAPTVGQKAMASAIPVSIASDQSAVPVTAPTLTKGTQGANGFSVQDLKDAGRVLKSYTVSGLACVTAEALISLTPYADLTAAGAATTFAVTSGKRLRIQSISFTVRNTSTVSVGVMVRFRMLAGTVLVTSPVHMSMGALAGATTLSVIGQPRSQQIAFPDGLELSGTMQFGLTQIASATTATIDVHVTGYEY